MRNFRWPAVALVLALLAVACNGNGGDGAGNGGDAAEGPQQLVVATGEDSYDTEPPRDNVGFTPRGIFETLVVMTPDYEVQPALATEWELELPNTWRFHLREDVTFHDGQAFNAEAVKYSFDRIAEYGGGPQQLGPDSTVVVDEYTVEITPKVENRRLVEQLVSVSTSIIAPGTRPGDTPIGTGPFRFSSYQPNEQIVMERNEDYWGEPAQLDRITFRFIPETNARRLALESGDVDVMLNVPLDVVESLESAGFEVDVPETGLYEALYLNISGEAGYTTLQDLNVRRAIGHAIDRDALVQGVFDGLAAPEQTFVPARLLGEHADMVEGYDTDLDRAAELLEDSGWVMGPDGIRERNGERLTLELINGFPSSQVHGTVPEFIQAQLRNVGIDVEIITTPDTASYQERLNNFQGDLWLERGNQNDANPAFLPALLFWEEGISGNIGYQPVFAPGWPLDGPDRVGNGEFDETIVRALAAPESDEAKQLTAEAMSILIDDYAIITPLAGLVNPIAFREGVQGLEAHPSGVQVTYDNVSVSR